MPSVKIDVAIGELVDKITVLEIKRERIPAGAPALANVERELDLLQAMAVEIVPPRGDIADLTVRLKEANRKIWDVVDDLHSFEAKQEFGAGFVQAARTAYLVNDERADLKRRINLLLGSLIVEEKVYSTP